MSINYFPIDTRTNNCATKLVGKPVFTSESATESVSVLEAKAHLYIEAGNTDFDSLLTTLIKQSREYIEQITAISLISRTVTAYFDYSNEFNIPFGPVTSFTSAAIKTGINTYETKTVNEDYELIDQRFISYSGNYRMKLIYVAGYTSATIPAGLKLAFLNEIARRFDNRGDGGVPESNNLLDSYKMLEWLV